MREGMRRRGIRTDESCCIWVDAPTELGCEGRWGSKGLVDSVECDVATGSVKGLT